MMFEETKLLMHEFLYYIRDMSKEEILEAVEEFKVENAPIENIKLIFDDNKYHKLIIKWKNNHVTYNMWFPEEKKENKKK